MKVKLTVILTFLFVFIGNASASIITFDEAGSSGSSFTSADGSILAEWVWAIGSNDGHRHLATGSSGAYEAGHGQNFQGIRFSSLISSTLTLDSFDLNGNWLVGTINDGSGTLYSSMGWTTQYVGLTALNPIYIYGTSGTGFAGLDNVVFSSSVPEPVTILLLALGLAGLSLSRKKNIN